MAEEKKDFEVVDGVKRYFKGTPKNLKKEQKPTNRAGKIAVRRDIQAGDYTNNPQEVEPKPAQEGQSSDA